jgi:hypothetical protein
MMSSGVDKRAIRAIIEEVRERKMYVVPFSAVLARLKLLAKDDGEAYELGAELYRALNEGRVGFAYLIGSKKSRIVVTPVELTTEQLLVLREMGRVFTARCLSCPQIPNEQSIDVVLNTLVDALVARDNLVPSPALAVYVLARNNGLKIQRTILKSLETIGFGLNDVFKPVEAFEIENIAKVVRMESVDNKDRVMWMFER